MFSIFPSCSSPSSILPLSLSFSLSGSEVGHRVVPLDLESSACWVEGGCILMWRVLSEPFDCTTWQGSRPPKKYHQPPFLLYQPVWSYNTQVCVYLLYVHPLYERVCGGRCTKTQKRVKEKGWDWPSPLTFLGPPGQEAWRARSDFWSRLFPAAYKNKWSKLPRVITRKWLRLAASHFSTHNTACISKWQSHAAWCIYWL